VAAAPDALAEDGAAQQAPSSSQGYTLRTGEADTQRFAAGGMPPVSRTADPRDMLLYLFINKILV
jgi:hypothetical protein